MQELGKFHFKIGVEPNGLEKHLSFSLDDKLVFSDSFQFLMSSLNSLVKNLGENDSKHLSQELDKEVLDLVKQNKFYPCEYMCNFEKFNENLLGKNKFYSSLNGKENSSKECQHVLKVWKKFETKKMKE